MPGRRSPGAETSKQLFLSLRMFPLVSRTKQPAVLLPLMNASSDVSVPTPPKYATGREGQIEGPRVLVHWPMTGVQGKPECADRMPLNIQPPRRLDVERHPVRAFGVPLDAGHRPVDQHPRAFDPPFAPRG